MLTVLPILLPMLAAALCVTVWGRSTLQAAMMVLTSVGMVAVAIALLVTVCTQGVQVSMLGGWTAPFGITFVADRFGSLMVLLASLVVVIVGGMGSIPGAALGALLIGLAEQFGSVYMPTYAVVLTFLIMVVVLAFRPQGLLGRG